jgi:hypothetical protein
LPSPVEANQPNVAVLIQHNTVGLKPVIYPSVPVELLGKRAELQAYRPSVFFVGLIEMGDRLTMMCSRTM